jgi:lipopolysaccharide transport system ATP-binding protein
MSSDPLLTLPAGALRLTGVGKGYRLYPRQWGRAAEWLGLGVHHHLHWVLKDIDLSLEPGEALGIVGENGAGKSTLLKLITGVSRPTAGSIQVGGKISALLELGIGFNAAFTGRQNAMHSLRLAGVLDSEIPLLLTDIEAFADLGDYFDYPVRTYSSGMQCRLGFATATAARPDVLIVDEALAVGDIFFQQRCYDRINAFRENGTTLLFVSHSAQAVFALCDRAVLLNEGLVAMDAAPRAVIDLYNAQVVAKSSGLGVKVINSEAGSGQEHAPSDPGASDTALETTGSYTAGAARLGSVTILQNDQPAATVLANIPVTVRVGLEFLEAVEDPHVGLQLRNARGEVLYRAHTHGLGLVLGDAVIGEALEVDFAFTAPLIPGDYTVTVGVGAGGKPGGAIERSLLRHQDIASFSLMRAAEDSYWDGVVNLQPQVVCRRLAASTTVESP